MKRTLSLCLALFLTLCALPAAAEETTTVLPFGAKFGMNLAEAAALLGDGAALETWYDDDQTGSVSAENVPLGIADLTAETLYLQVDRNNSAKKPRLTMLSLSLSVSDAPIASFRNALEALTAAYGEPESDPFDGDAVANYVENGDLFASWTKTDVRIGLGLSRMYDESLTLSFTSRLNYDAADLQ